MASIIRRFTEEELKLIRWGFWHSMTSEGKSAYPLLDVVQDNEGPYSRNVTVFDVSIQGEDPKPLAAFTPGQALIYLAIALMKLKFRPHDESELEKFITLFTHRDGIEIPTIKRPTRRGYHSSSD